MQISHSSILKFLFFPFLVLSLCLGQPFGCFAKGSSSSSVSYLKNKDFYVYGVQPGSEIRFLTVDDGLDAVIDDQNWTGPGRIWYEWLDDTSLLVHMENVDCKSLTPWIHITIPETAGYVFSHSTFGAWTGTGCQGNDAHYTGAPYFMDTTVQQYIGAQFGYESITFYLDPATYSIQYNGGGASEGEIPSQEVSYDTDVTLSQNQFCKWITTRFDSNGGNAVSDLCSKAAFLNWTYNGEPYAPGQTVRNLTTENNATITMTAVWGEASYTLPDAQRTGYILEGWYTSDGTYVGSSGESYSSATDSTLIAHWKPIQYTLVYHSNGVGSKDTISTTLTYDTDYIIPADLLSENGFVFQFWSTAPDGIPGSTIYRTGDTLRNLSTVQDESIHLYAQWDTDFTLDLNGNGGTLGDGTQDIYLTHVCNSTLLPEYCFGMTQSVTADQEVYFDCNKNAYTDHTYRYSQQGWSLNPSNYYYDDTVYYMEDSIHKYHTSSTDFLRNTMKTCPDLVTLDEKGQVMVKMFAIWDEAPDIQACDFYLTSQEIQTMDEGDLQSLLLSEEQVQTTDREDDTASLEILEIQDYGLFDFFQSIGSSTGADYGGASITYKATDLVDNISYRTIMLYITSTEPTRSSDGSGSITPIYCRYIDLDCFQAESHAGGLDATSKWMQDSTLKSELKDALTRADAIDKASLIQQESHKKEEDITYTNSYIFSY